jgi:hypothetical protein
MYNIADKSARGTAGGPVKKPGESASQTVSKVKFLKFFKKIYRKNDENR